jgi:2,3-bisphosphoglycerate-independent phosphoglycerate mutase
MTDPKLLLIILDGFGIRDATKYNAIANAKAPAWQQAWANNPHCLLEASGPAVGLPEGQMGNSEVGHMTIGAGRVIYQDLSRIDQAIRHNDLASNAILQQGLAKAHGHAIHFIGLLSEGGVHSHEQHLYALLQQCQQQGLSEVYIHAFLDGRDVPPKSATASLEALERVCSELSCGKIASLCGRYYAMDRDQRWDRVQEAYDLLTQSIGYKATSAIDGLQAAYERGESDEFVKPTVIAAHPAVQDGDVVIFWNYRSDRARELSRAFLDPMFSGFVRNTVPLLSAFLSLTQYADDINSAIVFPPQAICHTLGDCIADNGLSQLRLAETEKYAHVTFFFNGGREALLPHEQRLLIASPKVATYDLAPAMSAAEVSNALIAALQQKYFSLIVCNYANPDMVGHTGNYQATCQSIEALDLCLAQVLAQAKADGYDVIITADHGNAECMYDEVHQQPHTAHTLEPVPFVYLGRPAQLLKAHGTLADIAPTILHLLGLTIPLDMTGQLLLTLNKTVYS